MIIAELTHRSLEVAFVVELCGEVRGRTITLDARWVGRDLHVLLYGGDRSHIGAVSIAHLSPSAAETGRVSVSVSTISLPGHKDYVLSRDISERLAKEIGVTVVAVVGIHLDRASQDDIRQIIATVDALVEDLTSSYLQS